MRNATTRKANYRPVSTLPARRPTAAQIARLVDVCEGYHALLRVAQSYGLESEIERLTATRDEMERELKTAMFA